MSAASPPRRPHTGRIVVGGFIVLLGVGWLLGSLDVAVPWRVLLPSALVVVGLALVAGARSGRGAGGLIALGIVLTAVLAVGTAVDIPVGGGIGERIERPTTLGDHRYELAIGSMTVDLTRLSGYVPAGTGAVVEAQVGIGELVVVVPRRALVDVVAKAGVGQTVVFGRERSGVGVENGFHPRVPPGVMVVSLDLSVGLGRVEVRYG